MHDDDFELDFGEDELEYTPIAPAPPPPAPAAAAARPQQETETLVLDDDDPTQQQNDNKGTAASNSTSRAPPSAPSAPQNDQTASTSTTREEEAAAPRPSSSGAPGSWGRTLPRENDRNSRDSRDSRRDSGRGAAVRRDDRFAPRPSPSSQPSTPAPAPAPQLQPQQPSAPSPAPTPPPPSNPPPHNESLDSLGRPLPPGWVSRVSKSTQDLYYRNTLSNTSCWDIPTEPAGKEVRETTPPRPEPVVQVEEREVRQVEMEMEKEREKEQPKKLAVHPDRLRLVGATPSEPPSASTSTDSRTQPDGSNTAEESSLSRPLGFRRLSMEQGRKPLPPQQQIIPSGPRSDRDRDRRRGGRPPSFGGAAASPTSSSNTVPLPPTGPRISTSTSTSTSTSAAEKEKEDPAPRSAPAPPPQGPKRDDRWAVPPQGTGPRWATPAAKAAPTPPPPGLGPRGRDAPPPMARQSSSSAAAPTGPKSDRWAPPPPPTAPRGARLPLDPKALDDSLESYNAARPARSPSISREARPRSLEPTAAPAPAMQIDRDLPPHQRSRPQPQQSSPNKRRSLSPPLGPSPLQKKRDAAEDRRSSAGGRGPKITAANLAPLGPRRAFGSGESTTAAVVEPTKSRERSPPPREDRGRSRSPVRAAPAPAQVQPTPPVNNWGPRAARVSTTVAEPERRRRSPSPPLPSRRRSASPPSRRRDPTPPPRRRDPTPPPAVAYRSRSPPPHLLNSTSGRGRPRSRSRSPPLPRPPVSSRRPLSPPRPPSYSSSNGRRRSPSPPPRRRSPSPPPRRRRSPSPPPSRRYRDRSLSPPPRSGRGGRPRDRSPPRLYDGPLGPRRDPLPPADRWSIREGDRIDARTGEKLPPPGSKMRDWSRSPPPGNRGSHLRGRFRDAGGEAPELKPYVPPVGEEKTLPPSSSLPANPLLPSRPGSERTNGHTNSPSTRNGSNRSPPPPPPANRTPSLLDRLGAPPALGLPARPDVPSIGNEPIHLSIKRTASGEGDREGEKRRRER
ncbi:hypothetical protein BCR35DRAFT_302178 [Leucosporidium creatinivorum]|uniref:WW domain-containing protein n=1 Tax=Leucosporidium creatinivorum TaxID=106004 RepID=A0A1Y2FVT7_9BASI|nr:hypothetical protein BCR35DRAFT_302178 [Leucosporidium creatinivorum]